MFTATRSAVMSTMHSPPELMLRNAVRSVTVRPSGTATGKSYRAAVIKELGKPLVVQQLPSSPLSDGEVRVSVKTAAVNFADILLAKGQYQQKPPLPHVAGREFAGVISEVAPDVKHLKVGDSVLGFSFGGGAYAEEAVVPAESMQPYPKSLSPMEAASSLTAYGTAYLALTRRANIKEGDVVLVTAAAGSTGLAAVDVAANIFKAKVVAACGSDEKCQVAKNKGAMATINYNKESLKDRMKEITKGQGANIIFELVGGKLFRECLSSIAFEGTILPIGFTSGDIPNIPANLVLVKNIKVSGITWGSYSFRKPEPFIESVNFVSKCLAEGKIKPQVSSIFPLEQVNEAFKFVMDRKNTGKVVLKME